MEAADALAPARRSVGRRLADLFHGRPGLQAGSLLTAPLGWLVVGYLGSLAILLVAAFWNVSALTGEVSQTFSLDNFQTLVNTSVYRTIAFRTVAIAAAVTVTDAILAFPIAFYMAKVAGRRTKAVLVVAVLMPLWSSYLVKVYAWDTLPAVVAGSIFTFSLTLGDYITPQIVSNTQFIGTVVFNNFTNNLPLASAFATVPILVMVAYLLIARRLGAFEHL